MKKILFMTLIFSEPIFAQGKPKGSSGGETVVYSTNIDFESTLINGKMKAPTGFFLQGRNKQSLSNMVNLRSNFKDKLQNSRSAVRAMIK